MIPNRFSEVHYYPEVQSQHRDWEYRKPLLRKVLIDLNADIICLQEADMITFENDFGSFMRKYDYESVIQCVPEKNKKSKPSTHTMV